MDDFYPYMFWFLFFVLLLKSILKGERTSHRDEEIKDYWSDG